MVNRINFILVMAVCVLSILAFPEWVTAEAASMTEIMDQFQRETGKSWKSASPDERMEFLNAGGGDIIKSDKIENLEVTLDQSVNISDLKERAPYHIRFKYEKETGRNWDNASEEERTEYQKDYERMIKKIEDKEKRKQEAIAKEQRKIEREEQKKELALKKAEIAKKREAAKKSRELQKKKKDEQEKLKRAKEQRSNLQRKLKDLSESRESRNR